MKLKDRKSVSVLDSGKLSSNIKKPFVERQYYDFGGLIINDPSSFVIKNVTSNCSLLELVLTYFGSISEFFGKFLDKLDSELSVHENKDDREFIEQHIHSNIDMISKESAIDKIFNLKPISQCNSAEPF